MNDRLEQLHRLHNADPKDPFLAYGIALEHGKAGAHDDAITWLNKTLELDSQYCYAFFQKAKMLDLKGETTSAQQVLRDGIETAKQAGDDHAAEEMKVLMESFEE